jgi:hypothetical protein
MKIVWLALTVLCGAAPGCILAAPWAWAQAPAIEVAPGIALPSSGMVWVLATVKGKPTLLPLEKHGVSLNKHQNGSNFFAGLTRGRGSIDVPEPHAALRVESGNLILLARRFPRDNLGHDTASAPPGSLYQVIRMQVRRSVREVHMLDYGSGGKANVYRYDDVFPTEAKRIEGTPWLKIVPTIPLPPGEYAVEVKLADPNSYSMAIWDFGVDAQPGVRR